MGILLSVVISYAGAHELIECIKHILSGVVPETQPDFQDLVEYYSLQLRKCKSANPSSADWTKDCGQGYLILTENKNGKLESAAVKYYGNDTTSTAILFSTKISSFGQESVEDSESQANGDYRSERYITETPTTILTNASESYNTGHGNRSPARDNISDPNTLTSNSVEPVDDGEKNGANEKLKWHYRPKSPIRTPQTLPEIHFQSFDDNNRGVYSEDFLRSLDGIKFRPLQRSDPSGRRRSFKKRHSSSSNSSKESRASRDEEVKMFTSLEEAEFERMNIADKVESFGSTPNLSARSHSRSRSRENSREARPEHLDGSLDSVASDDRGTLKPHLKDVPNHNSFEEDTKETKVIEEDDEEDFWGNSGD